MPAPWLSIELPPAVLARVTAPPSPLAAQIPTLPTPVAVDKDLVVTSEVNDYDPVADVFRFEKGVVAKYGANTVMADLLIVDRGQRRAQARGNVRVIDPEAEFSADSLDFTWDPESRGGRAQNVRAQVGNVRVSAREVIILPTQYEFLDVAGTSCRERTPTYELRSRRLVVAPGKSGRAERPTLYAFGSKIVTLPDRSFELDRRTEGFQLPGFSRRRDGRQGIAWNSGFLLDDRTNLSLNYGAFENARPGFGAVVSRSFVPPGRSNELIAPYPDTQERFRWGYLENIQVQEPENERKFLRGPRRVVSLASVFNQGVVGRDNDLSFSKPFEITGELGGPFGDTGAYRTQVRLHTIQRGTGVTKPRAVGFGTLLLPTYELAPDVNTLIRIDTGLFAGDPSYGWIRGLIGVTYKPVSEFRITAGGLVTGDFGTPMFSNFDTLYAGDGFVWRADLNLGPTQISYMEKHDRRLGVYDKEYMVSQVVGCFEPYVLYRRYPGEYQLGLRLRLDDFYRILRRREFRQGASNSTVNRK